jgi:hypothetical protein
LAPKETSSGSHAPRATRRYRVAATAHRNPTSNSRRRPLRLC